MKKSKAEDKRNNIRKEVLENSLNTVEDDEKDVYISHSIQFFFLPCQNYQNKFPINNLI